MRKHSLKILLIAFISLGVIGLGLIISGTAVNDATSRGHYEKASRLSLTGVEEAYKAFGIGKETLDNISEFEKTLSEYSSAKNNIVIVDGNGSVLYKLNDNFLHLHGNSMNMAFCTRDAVTMDYSNSTRYWYLTNISDDGYMSSSLEYGKMYVIGDMGMPVEDVKTMLEIYDGKSAEANVFITDIRKDDGTEYPYGADYYPDKLIGMATPTSAPSDVQTSEQPQYLLWFRDAAMDRDIQNAIGSYYSPYSEYAVPFGMLSVVLYWLLAAVYVFIDARRRKTQPLPWALLVLLTNLVGLAVYWIYQAQNAKASPACPACGKAVNKSHMYCPWCGAPLARECKGCGKLLEKDWKACPWCGKSVE